MKGELVLIIEDVFQIVGKGITVIGSVQCEVVEVGQELIIDPEYLPEFEVTLVGIDMVRKRVQSAEQGAIVGLNLGLLPKNKFKKGMKIYTTLPKD